MTAEEQVYLRDDYYRDGIGKVIFITISVLITLALVISLIFYLHYTKPAPITFHTYEHFRVEPVIPVKETYVTTPELLQWTSNAVQNSFRYDFIRYAEELQNAQTHFTAAGWRVFINHLNVYANPTVIKNNKLFVNGIAAGAPAVINSGILDGKAAWWVQIPVTINYAGYKPLPNKTLTLQILIVRVSTLTNLSGLGIDNVIVLNSTTDQSMFGTQQ